MQQTLTDIAQQVMDRFYQTYKSDTDFFTLDDFIDYTGNSVADLYQSVWAEKYKELIAEKKDEVVTFDSGILAEQILVVDKDSKLKSSFRIPFQSGVMSFLYDQNNCGVQTVFFRGTECNDFDSRAIRTTLLQKNALKRSPICDRLFFYVDGDGLGVINKRMLPVDQLKVYYIPAINKDMFVPEGIRQKIVDATPMSLKEAGKNSIVRREQGNNPNKTLETEIDTSYLKK